MRGAAPPEFSASEAAFTGFRVVAARPWIVLVWAGLWFAFELGSAAFQIVSGGDAFSKWMDLVVQPPGQDPNALLSLSRSLAPTIAGLLIAEFIYYAIIWGAMNRAVFHPHEARFAYLRLAADELRQLGLFMLLAALFMGLCVAATAVASIVVVIISLATGSIAAVNLALEVLFAALLLAAVFFCVRFSLASPLTFATRRIDLLAAWRMTRRRFWPLVGAYLVALALAFVVVALTFAIAIASVALLGGMGSLSQLLQPPGSLAALVTPGRLVYVAVNAIGVALSAPVVMTPPATIYRLIAGRQGGA